MGVGVSRRYLEFTLTIESNDLVFENQYSSKQELLYKLIKLLHDEEGLGYRKIAVRLNSWGIKTHRGKKWTNSHVHSVIKRFNQRLKRIEKQRKRKFDVEVSDMRIVYE